MNRCIYIWICMGIFVRTYKSMCMYMYRYRYENTYYVYIYVHLPIYSWLCSGQPGNPIA